jgi:hypothetical protein
MPKLTITRNDSLQDRQRRIADMFTNSEQPFDTVIDLSICEGRQRRVQESEIHQDRTSLADVVREPGSQASISNFFSSNHPQGTVRLRQDLGVATRMSMKHHGWKKTGKRSSLWVFEHRWHHLRDRAGGRNHLLPSN